MGFASYTENIIERVLEARGRLYAELNQVRANSRVSDRTEAKAVAFDVRKFESETAKTLDKIDKSIANVFGDLLRLLRDPHFQYAAKIKKVEIQRDSARKERDDARSKRDKTRTTNSHLVQERDELRRENAKLAAELRTLKKLQSDQAVWAQAVKGVAKR